MFFLDSYKGPCESQLILLLIIQKLRVYITLHAPEPIPQKVLGKALASALKRPFFVPLWEWQLKLLFGSGSQILD